MLIQHFSMKGRAVPDPMRPGQTARVGYLSASYNSELTYTDPHTEEEVTVTPDADGWFEVPHEVGAELTKFRNQGSGFYSPDEIDENVRLGRFDGEPPAASETRRPASTGQGSGKGGRGRGRGRPAADAGSEPGDIVGPEDKE